MKKHESYLIHKGCCERVEHNRPQVGFFFCAKCNAALTLLETTLTYSHAWEV